MNNKSFFFSNIVAFFCIFFWSCDNLETPTNQPISSHSLDLVSDDTTNNNLAHFLQLSQTVEPGTNISSILSERFIKPALANDSLHPYLTADKATYSYGQIVYEDSAMVAFTFYYKAIHGKNLLAASFLTTFNPVTEAFIDAKMVFGSSTFDFQATKGYNMGYVCKSDMEFLDSYRIVLQLKCQIKQLYSHFKKNTPPVPNTVKTYRYALLKNGKFVFE